MNIDDIKNLPITNISPILMPLFENE